MKKIFTLLLLIACLSAKAQLWTILPHLDFDGTDTAFRKLLVIDTNNYHHNKWQIGNPHKAVFDSAFTAPNAIVTDTALPYGSHDTSVFILKLPRKLLWPGTSHYGPLYRVWFFYQLNVDSNATAILEISIDSGAHWLDVKDSLPISFSSNLDSSGFSHMPGWNNFTLTLNSIWGVDDTILLRFTFMSDSTASSKDGWMIDNISTDYFWESVSQLENNNLVSIYPNPANSGIYLDAHKRTHEATVTVLDILGRQVFTKEHVPHDGYLDLSLPDGVYTFRYATEGEYCIKRLIISN